MGHNYSVGASSGNRRIGKRRAPFSLGDPAVATGILTTAGFASIGLAEVHEPVFYGPDVDAAYDAVNGLGFVRKQRLRRQAYALVHG